MNHGNDLGLWPKIFEGQGHLRLKITYVKHKLNVSLISLTHGPILKFFVLNESWYDLDLWPKNFQGQGHLRLKIIYVKHKLNVSLISLTDGPIFNFFVLNELQ